MAILILTDMASADFNHERLTTPGVRRLERDTRTYVGDLHVASRFMLKACLGTDPRTEVRDAFDMRTMRLHSKKPQSLQVNECRLFMEELSLKTRRIGKSDRRAGFSEIYMRTSLAITKPDPDAVKDRVPNVMVSLSSGRAAANFLGVSSLPKDEYPSGHTYDSLSDYAADHAVTAVANIAAIGAIANVANAVAQERGQTVFREQNPEPILEEWRQYIPAQASAVILGERMPLLEVMQHPLIRHA